jgi:hypothetical protein
MPHQNHHIAVGDITQTSRVCISCAYLNDAGSIECELCGECLQKSSNKSKETTTSHSNKGSSEETSPASCYDEEEATPVPRTSTTRDDSFRYDDEESTCNNGLVRGTCFAIILIASAVLATAISFLTYLLDQ